MLPKLYCVNDCIRSLTYLGECLNLFWLNVTGQSYPQVYRILKSLTMVSFYSLTLVFKNWKYNSKKNIRLKVYFCKKNPMEKYWKPQPHWIHFLKFNYYHISVWQGVLDTTGQWFSPGTLVSSTNNTDCHDINEILLKMALNTITLTLFLFFLEEEYIAPPQIKAKWSDTKYWTQSCAKNTINYKPNQ